jgi:type II secretory pathway pseudopilin PulG
MRPSRFVLRALLILVLLAAVAIWGDSMRRRSAEYRRAAGRYAQMERNQVDALRRWNAIEAYRHFGIFPPGQVAPHEIDEFKERSKLDPTEIRHEIETIVARRERYRLARRRYERLARYPFLQVAPGRAEPE